MKQFILKQPSKQRIKQLRHFNNIIQSLPIIYKNNCWTLKYISFYISFPLQSVPCSSFSRDTGYEQVNKHATVITCSPITPAQSCILKYCIKGKWRDTRIIIIWTLKESAFISVTWSNKAESVSLFLPLIVEITLSNPVWRKSHGHNGRKKKCSSSRAITYYCQKKTSHKRKPIVLLWLIKWFLLKCKTPHCWKWRAVATEIIGLIFCREKCLYLVLLPRPEAADTAGP